ncbi:MAG: serine/threonine protein kinase [Halobacteriovorax sp.]|nr:serine/threonine protein kinase [Halobacteriovorax sp.]
MAVSKIDAFDFPEGTRLSRKYEIVSRLGGGWEGEVYLVREAGTDILRAAKFFYPQRNLKNKTVNFYAKKLHKLHSCNALIKYLSQDIIIHEEEEITYLISEFVEGKTLSAFLDTRKRKRLSPFQGLHLLYAIAKGVEEIHYLKEYHGDLHTDNVIVTKFGLEFGVKLIDVFQWGKATKGSIQDDVTDMIRIFYDALGGAKTYASQPPEIKDIICGLKKSIIKKKFKTAGQLRIYLEHMHLEVI